LIKSIRRGGDAIRRSLSDRRMKDFSTMPHSEWNPERSVATIV